MRVLLKIFVVIIVLLSFGNLFSAERESYKLFFPVDSEMRQPVNLGISFFTEDVSKLEFEEDGIRIKGEGYECYNSAVRAILDNDIAGVREYLQGYSGENEKELAQQLGSVNYFWKKRLSNPETKLAKIVKFGDYKIFFVREPYYRPGDNGVSSYWVLKIPIKNVNGKDYWIVDESRISTPSSNRTFAVLAIERLLNNKEMIADDTPYAYSFSATDDEDAICLNFNAEKFCLNDILESECEVLQFCLKARESISKDIHSYPDFCSKQESGQIANRIESRLFRESFLDDWSKQQILCIINADPMYIVYYQFPYYIAPRFVYKNGGRLYFVNSFGYSDYDNEIGALFRKNSSEILDLIK